MPVDAETGRGGKWGEEVSVRSRMTRGRDATEESLREAGTAKPYNREKPMRDDAAGPAGDASHAARRRDAIECVMAFPKTSRRIRGRSRRRRRRHHAVVGRSRLKCMSLAASVSRWRENSALRRDLRRAARWDGGNTHRCGGSCTTGCAPCGSWTWPSCLLVAERADARAKRVAGRHRGARNLTPRHRARRRREKAQLGKKSQLGQSSKRERDGFRDRCQTERHTKKTFV
jgi:hypothetical protein